MPMTLAFVRILFIFTATVGFFAAIIFGLNQLAPSEFPEFAHQLKQNKKWIIAFDQGQSKDSLFYNADSTKDTGPQMIAGARLQQLSDQSLVLGPNHFLQHKGEVVFLQRLTFAEWKDINPDGLTFSEFLERHRHRPIYIEVNHPQIFGVDKFYKTIKESRSNDNVLIQVASQGLKKSLKKLEPRWLYGANNAELGKFKLFSALFLAPLVEATYDFVVMKTYTEQQKYELQKRHILPLVSRENSIVSHPKSL